MLVVFTSIVHALASSDLAPPVEHWCRAPAAYSNLPLETWKNASVPAFHAAGERQSHGCFRYEPPFPVQGDPEADNRTLVPCDAGWDYEPGAAERSIVSAWNLVCGRRWMLSLLTAGYMAGGVLGGAGAGILADRIGRRPVLCVLIFVLILTGFATAFAQSMQVFAALRFVLSTAASSTLVTSIVLLYEVNDIDHRALFCALSVSGAGVTSAIYRALVVAFIRNREMAQIAYMVPTSALVVALYLMEESPRWLLATARVRQAEGVMQWAAYVNKVEKGDFKTRLTALRHEIRRRQEQLEHGVPSDFDAILSDRDAHVADLVTNATMRTRSFVMFGCSCITFAMFYHLSTSEVMWTSWVPRFALLALKIVQFPFNVYALRRIGSRLSLSYSVAALSIVAGSLAVVDVYRGPYALESGVTVAWLLVFEFTVVSVFAFSAELFPTVVRGAGVGLCYLSGRLGAMAGPFLNEVSSLNLRSVAYSVAAVLLLLFSLLVLSLAETAKLPLANTVRALTHDKWKLHFPLRLGRSKEAIRGCTKGDLSKKSRTTTTLMLAETQRRSGSVTECLEFLMPVYLLPFVFGGKAFVVSRIIYVLPYALLNITETQKVSTMIRKAYKPALGLPVSTYT
ncbi:solute carrier family 22 member 4-like [Haemaphysalis longicornis]